jgi:hypothetical protein
MKSNCISWALKQAKFYGGYIVFRWTRMNKLAWLKWPHMLWHSGVCPKDGEPCEGLISFVPVEKKIVVIPPLGNFEGEIKRGDAPEKHD